MATLVPGEGRPASVPRILVVDDEPHIAASVKDALRKKAAVTCADSASAALDLMTNQAFHVVLTDLRMPGMDGNEFLRRARAHFPDTVRLMWSGQADLVAASEAINSGGIFRFMIKPCNGPELETALFAAVGEFHRLEREREAALQDPLLGIGSRRAFDAAVVAAEGAVATGEAWSLAMIDVDEFKKYNDTYGHVAGDGALKSVAAVLVACARDGARVYRYGGEELALLSRGSREDAMQMVDAARVMLNEQHVPHSASRLGRLTFSAGVARFELGTRSTVERADAALYAAKHGGRNQVVAAE